MKKFIFLSLFFFVTTTVFAQRNSDSLAYQLQRKKINAMLAQRKLRFGQYDESLKMHTGIFGLQTKTDIRRSNDILMDVVKTDDSIYRQIKILLDFRAFQQTQVQSHSRQVEENTLGYMTAINKLRNKLDRLKNDVVKQQQEHEKTKRLFIIIVSLALASILLLLMRKRKQIA